MTQFHGRSKTMKSSKISITLAATALVVALFAATPISQAAGRLVLGRNSVGTAQLKRNAVTGPKVKNGSLTASDFRAGQLPAGPQGPKGDQGPIGPSDGFVASALGPIPITGWTMLRSITLPAGNYVLSGRAELLSNQTQAIRCKFTPSGTGLDTGPTVNPGNEVSISLTDTLALSAPTTVNFRCFAAFTANAYEPVVTAIKVGSLTIQ
jgi:hypothetical protein